MFILSGTTFPLKKTIWYSLLDFFITSKDNFSNKSKHNFTEFFSEYILGERTFICESKVIIGGIYVW